MRISAWCERRDLNPHELLVIHKNLNLARLPISPLSQNDLHSLSWKMMFVKQLRQKAAEEVKARVSGHFGQAEFSQEDTSRFVPQEELR